MLVQFHIQTVTKPGEPIVSEFVAQNEFDESRCDFHGTSIQQWVRDIAHGLRDVFADGTKIPFVCNQNSPEFFVQCGKGENELRLCKQRLLTPSV